MKTKIINNLEWQLKDLEVNGEKYFTFNKAQENCLKGWRLPTIDELEEGYENKEELNFKDGYYWSSNNFPLIENGSKYALVLGFGHGGRVSVKKINFYRVRYVRDVNIGLPKMINPPPPPPIKIRETPEHYNNDNGSLYQFAEQKGLNAWEFDIIKRIVRCRKKGNFTQDLEKTIKVIELYKQEYKSK